MATRSSVSREVPAHVVVRPATLADVTDIVAIWGELAAHHAALDSSFAPSEHWQGEYRHFVRSLLGRDDALAVVAVDHARVVGYAVGRISMLPGFFAQRERGYIHDAVVRKEYRRHGIGRQLVQALTEWMRAAGVSIVELTVATRNRDAVEFWRRVGFDSYMVHMKRELM
jgi:ribosomal protein S18 acetylase RimI-like enzyme